MSGGDGVERMGSFFGKIARDDAERVSLACSSTVPLLSFFLHSWMCRSLGKGLEDATPRPNGRRLFKLVYCPSCTAMHGKFGARLMLDND